MNSKVYSEIKKSLDFIYPDEDTQEIVDFIVSGIEQLRKSNCGEMFTEKSSILITYGDSVYDSSELPLKTLKRFVDEKLSDATDTIHILPFFPYSSDDGFSVIDYKKVNTELGSWSEINEIAHDYNLMMDLVVNHVSRKSKWFQSYIKGEEPFTKFFIEGNPDDDYSAVVRPRSSPLFTPYKTVNGVKYLWTTFSDDQIDLNFRSIELCKEIINVLFFYIENGLKILRLDAIAFLWKEKGTSSLHLPQTHEFVKLIRKIFNAISKDLVLLTETNVPAKENLSYFGNSDEAHMVYQFTLPPLLLYSIYSQDSSYLTEWASELPELEHPNTYFNFTASHDGIGVRSLEGIIDEAKLSDLIIGMKKNGALISEKSNSDGSTSPYEINITYYDACKSTSAGDDSLQIERFILSQAVMMTLQGVPAFYIHSLLGTENNLDGYKKTGMNRSVNRKKWEIKRLEYILKSENSNSKVFHSLLDIIKKRRNEPLFSPYSPQLVIDLGKDFFVVRRGSSDYYILAVFNITSSSKILKLPADCEFVFEDILSGFSVESGRTLELKPYQFLWLKKSAQK